jgi:hypothetical protein
MTDLNDQEREVLEGLSIWRVTPPRQQTLIEAGYRAALAAREEPQGGQPTDAELERGCQAFERVTQGVYGIEECVRAVLVAALFSGADR